MKINTRSLRPRAAMAARAGGTGEAIAAEGPRPEPLVLPGDRWQTRSSRAPSPRATGPLDAGLDAMEGRRTMPFYSDNRGLERWEDEGGAGSSTPSSFRARLYALLEDAAALKAVLHAHHVGSKTGPPGSGGKP